MSGTISAPQAETLARLMKEHYAHAGRFEEVEIMGLKATVVILSHDDQREGSWQTLHVLSQTGSSIASIGTIPKKEERRPR